MAKREIQVLQAQKLRTRSKCGEPKMLWTASERQLYIGAHNSSAKTAI